MVIIRSEFDYLQPSREGEEVLLATWITEWDERITMRRAFQVIRPADGATLLRARDELRMHRDIQWKAPPHAD